MFSAVLIKKYQPCPGLLSLLGKFPNGDVCSGWVELPIHYIFKGIA